jgi:hypothetical protein
LRRLLGVSANELTQRGLAIRLAEMAADRTMSGDDLRALSSTLGHSVGGTVVLLVILVLNVYKPQGMTRYGWRKQQEQRRDLQRSNRAGQREVSQP